MIRDNDRFKETWKIMNEMVEDGRRSPRPMYKFEKLKQKFKKIERQKKKRALS